MSERDDDDDDDDDDAEERKEGRKEGRQGYIRFAPVGRVILFRLWPETRVHRRLLAVRQVAHFSMAVTTVPTECIKLWIS